MASEINYSSIDATYPIAGKDNDTQGFRDNFGYVKTNFEKAKGEIETLQLNTAKLNDDNDFNFNQISKAALINCGDLYSDLVTASSNTNIQYSEGSLQKFNVTNTLTFNLQGFPAASTNISGRMKVMLIGDGTNRVITFAVTGGNLIKRTDQTNPITVAGSTNMYVFDFWSYGSDVYMNYLGTLA